MTPLRLHEVARMLGLPARTVRHLAASDPEFPVVTLGPRTRIVRPEDLASYIEKRRQGGRPISIPKVKA